MRDSVTSLPDPELAALADTLAGTHDADTLANALSVRRCNDGHGFPLQALLPQNESAICMGPTPFVALLAARLCIEGRGDLADALVALLRDAGLQGSPWQHGPAQRPPADWIGAPPNPHLMRWLREVAGPMVHPEPLAHSLVKGLRKHGRSELAEAVVALLNDAVFRHPFLQHAIPTAPKPASDANREAYELPPGEPSPGTMPLLPLRDILAFPQVVSILFVGRERSLAALDEAMKRDKEIFLAVQRNPRTKKPRPEDIFPVGTVGMITEMFRLPDGTVKVVVEGKRRAKIHRFLRSDPFFLVAYDDLAESQSVASTSVEVEVPDGGEPDEPEDEVPEIEDVLAAAHGADLLTRALIVRLCADGREDAAAGLMNLWVSDVSGPIVEAGPLAAALVEKLRADGRAEVGDALETLLAERSEERGPHDPTLYDWLGAPPSRPMLQWLMEAAGPGRSHAQPLMFALEGRLRADGRGELANAVRALLRGPVSELVREYVRARRESGEPGREPPTAALTKGTS